MVGPAENDGQTRQRYSAPVRFAFVLFLSGFAASPAAATFSIVASDAERREVGGAGASCVGSVISVSQIYGSVPGHGAIHVQAMLGGDYRMSEALRRLETDEDPALILGALSDVAFDPLQARRQYGIVDLRGRHAGFTGADNGAFAGGTLGRVSPYAYAAQGNLLRSAEVIQEMGVAFEADACDLPERLMAALEAGSRSGGDARCPSSDGEGAEGAEGADGSFLQVDREGELAGSYLSLRVDNVEAPIQELRRRFDVWRIDHPCTPLQEPEEEVGPAAPPSSTSCSAGGHGAPSVLLGLVLLAWFLRRRTALAGFSDT